MGQNVREEMARMRERYSRTFNVPLETVETPSLRSSG